IHNRLIGGGANGRKMASESKTSDGRKEALLIVSVVVIAALFGVFGSLSRAAQVTAQVEATVLACTTADSPAACTLALVNYGNAEASAFGSCSLTYGGRTYDGSIGTSVIVAAGESVGVVCKTASGPAIGKGVLLTGTLDFSSGLRVSFSGST
ncbi:MAG TPA: hypothetical protein VEJ36_03690, partial [Nitrososphaerales archaeon]|nr:hypothetical protein [Nitrososphaerales archaeon]